MKAAVGVVVTQGFARATPEPQVLLALVGFGAGFLSGFLGIGGGLVVTPLLMMAFGYPIKRAVGTALASIAFVSLGGVVAEVVVKRSNIHWAIGLFLTLASLLGARVGGKLLPRLPDTPLRLTFGGFLLFASYRMAAATQDGTGWGGVAIWGDGTVGYFLAFAVGAVAGLTSVLFGIGGGTVMVPAFTLLFKDFPFHAARSTSLLQIVPTSALGAYLHYRMGSADIAVARRLIPTGIVGAAVGVVAVNLLPARPCQLAFAAFLVLAAARLLASPRAPSLGLGISAGGSPRATPDESHSATP